MIKKFILQCACVLITVGMPILAYSAALDLPKDSNGWTTFTPTSEQRIMYVCAGGTGTVYTSTNHPDWENPFNPTGAIDCFPSFASAYANARNVYGDWILFKRGETFYDSLGQIWKNGKSSTEPFLVGSYGNSGASPVLKTGESIGLEIIRVSSGSPWWAEFVAIQGVEFYAHTRNPSDPEYVDSSGTYGFNVQSNGVGNSVRNILIEGCKFSFYISNQILADISDIGTYDIEFRRNVISYNYTAVRAQGLFSERVNRLLLEENVFYHNGWLIPVGQTGDGVASVENHNTYFQSTDNVTFRKNLFVSPSSMQNKFTAMEVTGKSSNISLDGNLYVDGEIGIGMGTNDLPHEWRFINPSITNNVFTQLGRSKPGNRTSVGWTMQVSGWDGGEISNNLEINNTITMDGGYSLAIELDESRNLDIYNNVHLGHIGATRQVYIIYPGFDTGIASGNIHDNYYESPQAGIDQVKTYEATGEIVFSNNQYYGPSSSFLIEGVKSTFSQWQSAVEPTATFSQRTFTDRNRTIETYMQSIGEGNAVEDLVALAIAQDRYNWDTRLTAESINTYLMAGFNMTYDGTLSPDPTCSDGIQNGDETGIDCGGSCPACESTPPGLARKLKFSGGGGPWTVVPN